MSYFMQGWEGFQGHTHQRTLDAWFLCQKTGTPCLAQADSVGYRLSGGKTLYSVIYSRTVLWVAFYEALKHIV